MQEHFRDIAKIQEVLQEAETGLWAIELDEGKEPRMYADGSMLRLLGFSYEPGPEECYREWYRRIEGQYYPIVQNGVDKMIQNNRAEVEYSWAHPQWGRIYVRCGGMRDWSYQEGVCLRGYHQNITDTVIFKQKARQREEILSNLCQCYYSIYLFDLENNAQEALWQEDYIHQKQEFPQGSLAHYYEKFVKNHVYEADQEKMRRAGSPGFLQKTLSEEMLVYEVDFRRVYPDRLSWVRSRFSVAEIRDGKVTKVIFANMDINEQKLEEMEQEEKNRQALQAAYETAKAANEAKSSFLAQMSHDIRTPLNAIIGMTAIASSQIQDREKIADCLGKIHLSSRHLLTLIDEVLDMSRIEKGKMELHEESFSFSELMEDVTSMSRDDAERKQQKISFKTLNLIHDKLIGDVGRLRQVLLNLITNAVKYTPEGGKISVVAQELSQRTPGQASFSFLVEDTGIGMSKEFLAYIFVPFSRADDDRVRSVEGTGLGMSIAHKLISAMGGNIQVESEPGKGSRFTVTLELKTARENEQPMSGTEQDFHIHHQNNAAFLKGKSLLLAEDNELNMEIARTLLEEMGFVVHGVKDGYGALQELTQSEPGTYDAILMDLQMPVMDGYTASREIRASHHVQAGSIPIIALTANAFAEDIAKSLAAGMNDHVSKPVDYDRLLDVLGKYIK